MGFEVSIEQFEGPLDLMLHLIKENKLDLFDLDMNILADQYINYIETMENMKLEIASEFLIELAGLLEYKSKKMLPKEVVEIEEEYEEDHAENLRKRLIEYKQYKDASIEFEKKYIERSKMLEKPLSKITEKWISEVKIEDYKGNPYDLIKAMNRVMKRYVLNKPKEALLEINEVSTEDRIEQLRLRLSKMSNFKLSLEMLCSDCYNLHLVITTFLSILVLIKEGEVNFTVDDNDMIWIMKGEVL